MVSEKWSQWIPKKILSKNTFFHLLCHWKVPSVMWCQSMSLPWYWCVSWCQPALCDYVPVSLLNRQSGKAQWQSHEAWSQAKAPNNFKFFLDHDLTTQRLTIDHDLPIQRLKISHLQNVYNCNWSDDPTTFLPAPLSVCVWSRFASKCHPRHLSRSSHTSPQKVIIQPLQCITNYMSTHNSISIVVIIVFHRIFLPKTLSWTPHFFLPSSNALSTPFLAPYPPTLSAPTTMTDLNLCSSTPGVF